MKREIIHVEDFDKSYTELEKKSRLIESNLQAIVFDYANKISGKLNTDQLTRIRNGISLRLKSILYFIELMKREKEGVVYFLAKTNLQQKISKHHILLDLVDNQKTIFDSILYHLSSLYDYYAKLSDFIYNNKLGLKWNGLANSAFDKNNIKISKLQKEKIMKTHKEFVDAVFSHRSFLIHNNVINPGFEITEHLNDEKIDILLLCPEKFIKEFKTFKLEVGTSEVSLEASLFWVLNKGLSDIISLLYGLKEEIERLRKRKDEDAIISNNKNSTISITGKMWVKE